MLQYIVELDGRILLFIQEFLRFEWLDPIVLFITALGNAGALWIVLAALLLVQKKYRNVGFAVTVSLLLGAVVTNLCLKNWICRPRPYTMIPELHALVTARDWSFPSGHSTSSIAAAVVILLRLPKKMGIPIFILAVLICLSRLYVGVHYPTDVLAGVMIGMVSAIAAIKLTERM